MATLGQVMVEVGADLSSFESSMRQVENNLRQTGQRLSRTTDSIADTLDDALESVGGSMDNVNAGFEEMHTQAVQSTQAISRNIDRIPEHLRGLAQSLQYSRQELREMSREGVSDLSALQDAVINTRTGLENMTSVSSSGREAIAAIQEMREETNLTRMAVLGFNRDATVKLSTEEAQIQMRSFQQHVDRTRAKLEELRDSGDFGSYQAGMQLLEQQIRDVDTAIQAASRGGTAYMNVLRQMGVITSSVGNQSAVAMERMRDSFINANNVLQARATQSEKIIKNLARMDVRGLDQQFLQIGVSLERMAKAGSVANVAIKEVGENASMKDILDQVTLINAGIMRMQMVSQATGVALLGLTAIMAALSHGANVEEVRQQQAEITAIYKEELQKRADELYNFAGLFEDVELVKISKEKLIKNLQEQVNIMKDWMGDLKTLAKRGVDEGMIKELEKLGPASAGEINAMMKMSDKELSNYVSLWKEKHKLARTQAVDELQELKEQTKAKVKELEDTLKPLGLALEEAKGTWAEAVKPFAESWGYAASKVVEVFNAVGQFINKVNELNPQITAVIGNIAYLATAFAFLLSPLAIGISRAGSFAVAFNQLWMVIGPLVTGLLAVAGTAILIATAIVGVITVFRNLWTNSEELRTALTNLWTSIKEAVKTALQPLMNEFGKLGGAFKTLVQAFLGEGKSMSDFWQLLGDKIAGVITKVTPYITSILTNAVKIAVAIIVPLVQFLVTAFQAIADWWGNNSGQVMSVIGMVKDFIVSAFQQISSFLSSIMPVIMQVISVAFGIIRDVAAEVFPLILALFNAVFPVMAKAIQVLMPLILAIIQSVWNNVKNVITSGLQIILNVFLAFKNLFSGNWNALWENIKLIIKNALKFAWNLIQVIWVGKAVKGLLAAGKAILSGTKAVWTSFKDAIRSAITNTKDTAVRTITNMKTSLLSIFRAVWNGSINAVQGMKAGLSVIWSSLKTIASTAFNNVKNAILKPIQTAKEKVLGIIQAIKDAFSRAKISLPKIKVPKLSIGTTTKTIAGKQFSVPSFGIKWNAKGNIFTGASLLGGGQGVGEAGAEAVMPIQRKRLFSPWASMVSDLLADNLGGNGAGTGNVVNKFEIAQLIVREEADVDKIADALERKQRIQDRAKGGFVFA
ncbi:hypothetical protein NX029_26055 [Cytobacillus firmus]|nr:hypothetical protein [Cytobacillus firmus]